MIINGHRSFPKPMPRPVHYHRRPLLAHAPAPCLVYLRIPKPCSLPLSVITAHAHIQLPAMPLSPPIPMYNYGPCPCPLSPPMPMYNYPLPAMPFSIITAHAQLLAVPLSIITAHALVQLRATALSKHHRPCPCSPAPCPLYPSHVRYGPRPCPLPSALCIVFRLAASYFNRLWSFLRPSAPPVTITAVSSSFVVSTIC